MAAPWNPPVRNEDFQFLITVEDFASPGRLKANPTIAAGDFKISKDEGAFANFTNLPSVLPASGVAINIELTSTEMDADKIVLTWIDQTSPPEWCDGSLTILTTA